MKTKIAAVLIALALFSAVAGCDGGSGGGEEGGDGAPGPGGEARPVVVDYIELRPVVIRRTNELPGRVVAYRQAEIRPQVSGIIQSRLFEEGSRVEEGQQLYRIDPARYEADHEMAEARLQDARARRENALLVFNRFQELLAEEAISRQEYDDARSRLHQAEAAVGLAEAEVARAEIDLDYTSVHAPIGGYIGPSAVTEGALVAARQEAALATVRQLDPVYVDLSQAAAEARLVHERLVQMRADNGGETDFPVTLDLGDAARTYPHEGRLDATDPAVDPRTGAIRLRCVFPNPDRVLLPGMFVRASIVGVGRSREIVVPQKSVALEAGGQKSVWLIGPGDKATKRPIRAGAAYKASWVVLNGLEAGERLIVEGTMNLSEGAAVKPEKIETYYETLEEDVPPDTLKERAPAPRDPGGNTPVDTQKETAGPKDAKRNSDGARRP